MYEEISADIRQQGQTNTCFFLNNFGDDNQFTEEITPLILAAQAESIRNRHGSTHERFVHELIKVYLLNSHHELHGC